MKNEKLVFTTIAAAKKLTGLSYIGSVNSSAKIVKNEKFNQLTYIIYFAPHTLSGYNVCPMATGGADGCISPCIHWTGHNRIDTSGRIDHSRINKTKLFFEQREFIVNWIIAEIKQAKKKAEKLGFGFSVRLNGTSDIDPTLFAINGRTLFEIFPDTIFYDYSKVFKRFSLLSRFPNYDLTFSYSGDNMPQTFQALENGHRVAIVFEKSVPVEFMGFPVVDGDSSDLRFLDPGAVIVGLKFKKGRNKLVPGRFVIPYGSLATKYAA